MSAVSSVTRRAAGRRITGCGRPASPPHTTSVRRDGTAAVPWMTSDWRASPPRRIFRPSALGAPDTDWTASAPRPPSAPASALIRPDLRRSRKQESGTGLRRAAGSHGRSASRQCAKCPLHLKMHDSVPPCAAPSLKPLGGFVRCIPGRADGRLVHNRPQLARRLTPIDFGRGVTDGSLFSRQATGLLLRVVRHSHRHSPFLWWGRSGLLPYNAPALTASCRRADQKALGMTCGAASY